MVFDEYFSDEFCLDLFSKVSFIDKFIYNKLRELKAEILDELATENSLILDDNFSRAFDQSLNKVTGGNDIPK